MRRRKVDSIEVQQMKAQAKEEKARKKVCHFSLPFISLMFIVINLVHLWYNFVALHFLWFVLLNYSFNVYYANRVFIKYNEQYTYKHYNNTEAI